MVLYETMIAQRNSADGFYPSDELMLTPMGGDLFSAECSDDGFVCPFLMFDDDDEDDDVDEEDNFDDMEDDFEDNFDDDDFDDDDDDYEDEDDDYDYDEDVDYDDFDE